MGKNKLKLSAFIDRDLLFALEDERHRRSRERGTRVSGRELVEAAIRAYLGQREVRS